MADFDDDSCPDQATEQFAWCDIRDGVMRFSVPYCSKHSETCQPAEATEVQELLGQDYIGCQRSGEDWAAEVDSPFILVADEGQTLIIDGEGEDSSGASIDDTMLVLVSLDVPARVVGQMENTRALDGMQEAEWDDFTATWTYHPDEGLDIIVGQA